MLAILTTHPIQYQVPLWQALAREGRVPFEVWYLSDHGARISKDKDFGQEFAWDLDLLQGYKHRFLKTPAGTTPNGFWQTRISESLEELLKKTGTTTIWVQGWQVAGYWQAVWTAHKAGIQVWLRGESNNMAPTRLWKQIPKRILLGQLFRRVGHFLCIGTANRDLYRSYGVPESRLHMAPYAVDNERFETQAERLRGQRSEMRRQWGIAQDAFVILFCGKFIPKKRPLDLIEAAQLLLESHPELRTHLLFVGNGELGAEMRSGCDVVFDVGSPLTAERGPLAAGAKPSASFTGFLNQTEISKAYVVADALVLPSDYGETWGLVVNEAMASGLSCIISDRCGCAADIGESSGNSVFRCGDVNALSSLLQDRSNAYTWANHPPSFKETVAVVEALASREDRIPARGKTTK